MIASVALRSESTLLAHDHDMNRVAKVVGIQRTTHPCRSDVPGPASSAVPPDSLSRRSGTPQRDGDPACRRAVDHVEMAIDAGAQKWAVRPRGSA
jgi:hypothetical protein